MWSPRWAGVGGAACRNLPRTLGAQGAAGALGDDSGLRTFRLGCKLFEGLPAVAPCPVAQKVEIETLRRYRSDLQPAQLIRHGDPRRISDRCAQREERADDDH